MDLSLTSDFTMISACSLRLRKYRLHITSRGNESQESLGVEPPSAFSETLLINIRIWRWNMKLNLITETTFSLLQVYYSCLCFSALDFCA